MSARGIIYEYEDGGKYCGEWENNTAHGHGVCTGPGGNGRFEGLWEKGNQSSGVFTWPNGQKYAGKWRQGLREGLGKETKPDGTEYCGEFSQDSRGQFGVLRQPNGVVYRGTWRKGIQNGEGTEIYIDGGMYRGEYLNGYRHGHGTRSSSTYEQNTDQSSSFPSPSSMSDMTAESIASALEIPTSSMNSSMCDTNLQVYEGEWKSDKRHGHGVLKIIGHYTYYGEWEENLRSGYGVMIYEDKRKEEGQWQRGKLALPLKRKKLQLKMRQLESKVNLAHMNALQAADAARLKAELAESRSSTASSKARYAVRSVQQAVKDAELACMKESLFRNAPKVKESMKSPVTDLKMDFPASDINFPQESRARGRTALGQLTVPRPIQVTPSFEDIANLVDDNSSNRYSIEGEGSDSNGSSGAEDRTTGEFSSLASQSSADGMSEYTDVKRDRFQKRSDFRHRRIGDKNTQSDGGSCKSEPASMFHPRQAMIKLGEGVGASDPNLLSKQSSTQLKVLGPRSTSGPLPTSIQVTSTENEPRRRRNQATGEPAPGDTADDEQSQEISSIGKLAPPKPLEKSRSISMDMLHQIASWNKMIAYINLALLFFLLFLIVIVIVVLNYYYLVHQLSASHPTTPPTLMAGPLA